MRYFTETSAEGHVLGRADVSPSAPIVYLSDTVLDLGALYRALLAASGRVYAREFVRYGARDSEIAGLDPRPKALVSYGASSLDALHYAIHNPDSVTCVACIEPEFDTSDLYNSDTAHRPGIEEAWGISYPTPLPPGANPRGVLSQLRVPVRIYAPDIPDEYAETARVEHLRSLDPEDLASWVRQHSA